MTYLDEVQNSMRKLLKFENQRPSARSDPIFKLSQFNQLLITKSIRQPGLESKAGLPMPAPIYSLGETRNNLRQLVFVNGVLNGGTQFEPILPIRLVEPLLLDKDALGYALKLVTRAALLAELPLSRAIQQFCWEFAKAFGVLGQPQHRPKLFLFFNDHTPRALAWSLVCKIQRIPRMYIQHAPVSELFPPLDFEAAILLDHLSRDTYERIGALPERTWVIPHGQSVGEFETEVHMKSRRVCVYLTPSQDSIDNSTLAQALKNLEINPQIDHLILSVHPREIHLAQLAITFPSWTLTTGLLNEPHIALVGNSGISFELIQNRIPQLKIPEIDLLGDDYHGLIASNQVNRVQVGELTGPFWDKLSAFGPKQGDDTFGYEKAPAANYIDEVRNYVSSLFRDGFDE